MKRTYRPTVHANLAFVFKITLIGYDNDGEGVLVLDTKNLLMEGIDFLERVTRRDRVDEKETFACAHILFTHGPVHDRRWLSFERRDCVK